MSRASTLWVIRAAAAVLATVLPLLAGVWSGAAATPADSSEAAPGGGVPARTEPARSGVDAVLDAEAPLTLELPTATLTEVAAMLSKLARSVDPQKRGAVFTLAGAPESGGVASLARVRVTVAHGEWHRLRDVLDAVCEGASEPLTFRVQEDCVVFERPATPALLTQTYRMEPAAVVRNLAQLERTAGVTSTNPALGVRLRLVLAAAGVEFDAPAVGKTGGANPGMIERGRRGMLFNEKTGLLFVRATTEEMEVIDRLMRVVLSPPPRPQVMIEAKFVEITLDTGQEQGLGWLAATGATNARSAEGVLPGTALQEKRGDELPWAGQEATSAQNIRLLVATNGTPTGILTEPQFRVLVKALEERNGVDMLAAPRLTTLSGRQGQIQVSDIKTVVTGINPEALVQAGGPPATNVAPFATAQIPCGPTLAVVPNVGADGFTIDLNVTATVCEFLGYDKPAKPERVSVWQNGEAKIVDVPQPRFRLRQRAAEARLWDGQTLVLGGVAVPAEAKGAGDGAPETSKWKRKQLLVFVTPTLVNDEGSRIHTAEDMPFAETGIPTQGGH